MGSPTIIVHLLHRVFFGRIPCWHTWNTLDRYAYFLTHNKCTVAEPDLELREGRRGRLAGRFCFLLSLPAFPPSAIVYFLPKIKTGGPPLHPPLESAKINVRRNARALAATSMNFIND